MTFEPYLRAIEAMEAAGWPAPDDMAIWPDGGVRAVHYGAPEALIERALIEGSPGEWYGLGVRGRDVIVVIDHVTIVVIQSEGAPAEGLPVERLGGDPDDPPF